MNGAGPNGSTMLWQIMVGHMGLAPSSRAAIDAAQMQKHASDLLLMLALLILDLSLQLFHSRGSDPLSLDGCLGLQIMLLHTIHIFLLHAQSFMCCKQHCLNKLPSLQWRKRATLGLVPLKAHRLHCQREEGAWMPAMIWGTKHYAKKHGCLPRFGAQYCAKKHGCRPRFGAPALFKDAL